MDGKGWKPQYGISPEGIEILGFVEALPREARRELLQTVARLCRSEGYLSLHDDLHGLLERARRPPRTGKVIPLFSARRRG
ncbi:MAG: hypothetical protein ABR567_12260 [Myxococcales bacterium]|nr:hypothetical protein [Myxococcales bacterium]